MYDNIRSDYRAIHRPRRRSGGSATTKTATRSRPLLTCALVLAFAVAIHFLFPHFSRAVGDKVSAFVDYRTAFAVLAEGISGERKLADAFGEAWTVAFRSDGDAEDAVAPLVVTPLPAATPEPDITPDVGVFSEQDDATSDALAPPASAALEVFAEEPPEAPVSEFAQAAMAAFAEAQYAYSDYMIPAGVSYDMPALGISGTSPTNGVVSSGFGFRRHPVSGDVKFHYGTDIAAPRGTPIYAFADGVVSVTGESATLGKYITVTHSGSAPDGDDITVTTTYAHCGEVLFPSGATVVAGDKIASVSRTGNATGDCLHFELKVNGEFVNPEFYVQW